DVRENGCTARKDDHRAAAFDDVIDVGLPGRNAVSLAATEGHRRHGALLRSSLMRHPSGISPAAAIIDVSWPSMCQLDAKTKGLDFTSSELERVSRAFRA